MKIVIVSVVLNIHQVALSDELYAQSNGDFRFIETNLINGKDDLKGGGSDFSSRKYLIRAAANSSQYNLALDVIRDADVMIYDGAPLEYLRVRLKTEKLTFIQSERWLKKGLVNLLSPRLIQQQLFYHAYCRNKPIYALCASAYAAKDFALMYSFKSKCFRWGYFTTVPQIDIDAISEQKICSKKIKILWVARFIDWKHPETMIDLAVNLRKSNIDFCIDMIGTGPLLEKIEIQISKLKLGDYVRMLGSLPNQDVVQQMRTHHIFCLTSDKNEGWGVVLNEAMSNGCCPVASLDTGSAPFLIKSGVNGLTFKLNKDNDLFEKVLWLINHKEDQTRMGMTAYYTMLKEWNPRVVAMRFIELSKHLLKNNVSSISFSTGVCSKI